MPYRLRERTYSEHTHNYSSYYYHRHTIVSNLQWTSDKGPSKILRDDISIKDIFFNHSDNVFFDLQDRDNKGQNRRPHGFPCSDRRFHTVLYSWAIQKAVWLTLRCGDNQNDQWLFNGLNLSPIHNTVSIN